MTTNNSSETLSSNMRRDRLIVAVWHTAGKGKSGTLRALARQIERQATPANIILLEPVGFPAAGDGRIVARVGSSVVAVESKGDPRTGLEQRLNRLADPAQMNADLIFCSCRTSGETMDAIGEVAGNHGFRIIWTSTYESPIAGERDELNDLKADHLIMLARNRGFL